MSSAVATAVGAWPAAPASVAREVNACGPAKGQTLAHDPSARVYAVSGLAYACTARTQTPLQLGSTTMCNGVKRAGPFVLAGDVLAYGLESCTVDTGATAVVVRTLRTGRITHTDAATSARLREGYGSVASLVVKPDGAVAWIGLESTLISTKRLLQVHAHDRRGRRRLDSSALVQPASLKLRGSEVTWLHGAKTRRATLA